MRQMHTMLLTELLREDNVGGSSGLLAPEGHGEAAD